VQKKKRLTASVDSEVEFDTVECFDHDHLFPAKEKPPAPWKA
jgi:hypothetical protein